MRGLVCFEDNIKKIKKGNYLRELDSSICRSMVSQHSINYIDLFMWARVRLYDIFRFKVKGVCRLK